VLRACKQFLDGELPDGPCRLFHRSFANYLLEDEKNMDYRIDPAQMHLRIADAYCPPVACKGAWTGWDENGVRFTPVHLAKAAERFSSGEKTPNVGRLVSPMADRDYQTVHLSRLQDLAALQGDLELSLRTAADNPDPSALPMVVEMALALDSFRRDQLQPRSLFDLANQGEIEQAEGKHLCFCN
jgi:hypothetical protein